MSATTAAADPVDPDRPRPVPPGGIGMHLYTMRGVLAQNFPGTLERLATMGYATVGVSGRHGYNAAQIRTMLDDTGLTAVLEHTGYDRIRNNWQAAVDDVLTLGGRWVVIASLPGSLHTPDGFRRVADEFNAAGEIAHAAGLKLLFHNHGADHAVMNGESLYDILVSRTDPRYVGYELDLYWAVNGGGDPIDYFTRYPNRFPALHVKDMRADGWFADVGSGILDFPAMFAHCQTGGVKQWLVEHDSPADAFVTAQNSYDYLSTVRY